MLDHLQGDYHIKAFRPVREILDRPEMDVRRVREAAGQRDSLRGQVTAVRLVPSPLGRPQQASFSAAHIKNARSAGKALQSTRRPAIAGDLADEACQSDRVGTGSGRNLFLI